MERIKVQSNDRDIHIDCPHCDNWEQLGVDDPRHHLNVLPIVEWYPDERDKNEVSLHECVQCKNKFEVEWDYTNPININNYNMEEVDLFTCVETLPPEVQAVLKKHQEDWEDTYNNCAALLKDLESSGYTFDYYLDAVPFNLRLKTD